VADRHSLGPGRELFSRAQSVGLPYAELPDFIAKLRAQEGVAARALEFTTLTAARTSDTIGAVWDEVNTSGKVWTVPGDRMKAGKEHRVPLPPRALAILSDEGLTDIEYVGQRRCEPDIGPRQAPMPT
jgi:integrase